MLKIEVEGRLRSANDAVLYFMREHRVATLWGRGLFASADMMSLEATRYLWSARLDPRRRDASSHFRQQRRRIDSTTGRANPVPESRRI